MLRPNEATPKSALQTVTKQLYLSNKSLKLHLNMDRDLKHTRA